MNFVNDECDQCDEIMVLKSIYGERNFHCDVNKHPYEGKLNIDVDLHNFTTPISVAHSSDADNIIQLKFLPPLCLNFWLPCDYPSKNPPKYSLSCSWLSPDQIEQLNNELNSLWLSNNNAVILYTWLNVLQTETLNLLNIKFPIILTRDKILNLMEYELKRNINNNLRSEKEFRSKIHNCSVCFCEKLGHLCVHFPECGHIFCKQCLTEFLNIQIKDGNVKSLQCLAEKCSTKIEHYIIKQLVDDETFERYDRLLLQTTLELMPDIAYCPRPQCGCPVIIDRNCSLGSCQACQYVFCIYCKMVYHGIEKCRLKAEEMKKLRNAYLQASKTEQIEIEKIYGKKRIQEILSEFETEEWLESNSKKCPRCSANIEKNSGCNKMTCTKCKAFFCWLCLQELKGPNPYSHFAIKQSTCYNKLFPQDEEDEENILFQMDEYDSSSDENDV